MPVVAKCPNCNAPLESAPSGPEQKCPYCGATLLATRFMQSPVAVPSAATGGWSSPGATKPGWTTPTASPEQGAPVLEIRLPVPSPVARKGSTAAVIAPIVMTLLIVGGTAAIVYFAHRETQQRVQQATQAAAQAAEARTRPLKLPPLPLEPGSEVELNLPSSTGTGVMGRVVATLNVNLTEATPLEITAIGSAAYVSCKIKALNDKGETIARSEEDDVTQLFAVMPQGASSVVVDCDSHPSERSVRVLARPMPTVTPDTPVLLSFEPGMKSTGAIVEPGAAGLYAVAALADDSSVKLEVVRADGQPLGAADVDSGSDRAVVDLPLESKAYLARTVRTFPVDRKLPVTMALTRIEPEALTFGTEVSGTLTRYVERRYYLLRLDAPTKVAATLTAPFTHGVEIQRADGLSLAAATMVLPGREARAVPATPLEAGTYRIAVFGEPHSVAEGVFRLRVAVAEEEAPAARRGGRRGTQ